MIHARLRTQIVAVIVRAVEGLIVQIGEGTVQQVNDLGFGAKVGGPKVVPVKGLLPAPIIRDTHLD